MFNNRKHIGISTGFNSGNGLSPKRTGGLTLQSIVDKYNSLNAWSAENSTIVGTTTTALDYKGLHDLVNPSAAAQPTYNASNAAFNNYPTLNFDGVSNMLRALVSGWRFGDTNGVITSVFSSSAAAFGFIDWLDSGDTTAGYRIYHYNRSGKPAFVSSDPVDGGKIITSNTSPSIIDGNVHVVSIAYIGTVGFKFFVNGVLYSTNVISGSDNGRGLGYIPNRDNITIGATVIASTAYGKLTWAYSDYTAYVSDALIIAQQNDLMTLLKP